MDDLWARWGNLQTKAPLDSSRKAQRLFSSTVGPTRVIRRREGHFLDRRSSEEPLFLAQLSLQWLKRVVKRKFRGFEIPNWKTRPLDSCWKSVYDLRTYFKQFTPLLFVKNMATFVWEVLLLREMYIEFAQKPPAARNLGCWHIFNRNR